MIDREILEKRMAIPNLIADLSELDKDSAIHYIQVWGRKEMPITPLFEELSKKLMDLKEA